jgi:predicted transcriptional regulator
MREYGFCDMIALVRSTTKKLLDQVASWPEQDQDELAEYAREIEARRTGVYVVSDEEWADLQEGIAQADRGEFVPDEVVAKADERHGL